MSVDYLVSSFDSPTAKGATLTLPIGFESKLIFLWSQTAQAYETFTADALHDDGYGFQQTPLTPMENYFFATRWISLFNKQAAKALKSGPTIFIGADLNWSATVLQNTQLQTVTGTDATFVFTFTATTAPPYKYEYLAIGGSDVHRNVGNFNAPNAPGNVVIPHGLPDAPTFVQFSFADFSFDGGVTARGACWSRGYTNGVRQGVTAVMSKGDTSGAAGANPGVVQSAQRTDACVLVLNGFTGAIIAQAALVSIDATNITINFSVAGGYPVSALSIRWLAVSGVTCDVGSFSQPTATGVQAVTTAVASPRVVIVQSFGQVASTAVHADLRFTAGVTNGTAQHALWMADNTGVTFGGASRATKIHTALSTVYSATPTSVVAATALATGTIAMTASGFNVTWGVADTIQREWIYVAFGDAAPGRIVVQKIIDPVIDPTAFDFTASGGLLPASFSLAGGVSQFFEDVPAGAGYGIAETPNAAYVTTVHVSNGSPADNLTVAQGETVTVTFTNTQIVPQGPPGCPLGYPDAVTGRDGCGNTDL